MNPPMVVILGAGRPFSGSGPSALTRTSGDRRVLDWLLEGFRQELDEPSIHFVGGYRMDKVVDQYPDIHFSHNEDWETTGTVGSLLCAPLTADRELYVCYSDIVFQADIVEALRDTEGDAAITVDTDWRIRYTDRDEASLERAEKVQIDADGIAALGADLTVGQTDAEFTGLLRLSPACLTRVIDLADAAVLDESMGLPDLVRLLNVDAEIDVVDVRGNWAELETPDDLARFVLDTKANTLRRLESMVERSTIVEQYTFTVGEWRDGTDRVLDAIRSTFDDAVIVRSSARAEDTWQTSNAGRFESVLDIPVDDSAALKEAIERVVESYRGDDQDDQVLVQPMVTDVDHSGVVMTRSIETGSPYYVINYDATTASTETVTDGSGKDVRTTIVRKDGIEAGVNTSIDRIQSPAGLALDELLASVRELENLIGHDSLDVEFAVTTDGSVYVLQVRPMTVDPAESTVDDETIHRAVSDAKRRFRQTQPTSPFVLGERTVFGVMPDWNPAEIIGRKPRLLAESLYRHLVTDEIWATQRAEYGYRDVRPHPLIRCFAGHPYVDVRAVLNSFIPATIPDDLATRLVEYGLDRLEAHPEFHDKVEFEIAVTCLPFDFGDRVEPMLDAGFTRDDLQPLREGLERINRTAVERVDADLETIDRLEDRYRGIANSDLPPLEKAQALLEDCRRLGTLPFAHLARSAFVAVTLLRSLERREILTDEDVSRFLESLNTVARHIERDGYRVATGDLPWDAFVDRYGHLRPGTYEITSPAYADDPETYLRPLVETAENPAPLPDLIDIWDDTTRSVIEDELGLIGLPPDIDQFISFLRDAIEGREYAKFVFSKNLSAALEEIAIFGEDNGLSREQLAHVSIADILGSAANPAPDPMDRWLADRAREGRRRYVVSQSVELPPLLFDDKDFDVFEWMTRDPNFVTDRAVRAKVVELTDGDGGTVDIDGKLVLIEAADPGYDWLFGQDIDGLITMYGGANSHMAIRAAEFSLPAVIGVGERLYQQLQGAEVVELDCSARVVREVK